MTATLNRVAGWAEGLMVLAVGLYMVTLAESDAYWALFNPKFRWLTASGGLMASLAGVALFFIPAQQPKLTRLLAFAVFLGFLASYSPPDAYVGAPFGGGTSDITGAPHAAPSGRVTLDGVEYVALNLGELFFLTRRGTPEQMDANFVTRGIVRRTAEMDAQGHILLTRLVVSCCLADAITVAIRVDVDDPATYVEGDWLEIHGRLKPHGAAAGGEAPPETLNLPNTLLVAVVNGHAFQPDALAPPESVGLPYVFEIRTEEPYANEGT